MRILGIDPGIATIGFGLVEYNKNQFKLEKCGVITTPAHTSLSSRLNRIYADMNELLHFFTPDSVSVEELFFNTNITTGISVAHGRGVILLACEQFGVPIFEYTPLQVKQAVAEDESKFLASDDYHSLQRRIASGNRLKEQDWSNVEEQMKHAWPGFSSQLRTLYPMSELEYQVCMLIKLRMPPTDIATVLARDISTISTVRSRLYKKVFGRKGGAREWDEFILSIGT